MAQLTTATGRRGRGAIKLDMTPMVDLAFLLLTFFVLTMTLNKQMVMPMNMPEREGPEPPTVNIERVLTLILGTEDRIYYYHGDSHEVKTTDYSKEGIRQLLFNKKSTTERLVVLVKPSAKSRYKNMIDILDEIHITKVPHYYVVKETDEDRALVASVN